MFDALALFGRKGSQALERLGRGHILLLQILAGITSLLPRLGLLIAQAVSYTHLTLPTMWYV